jgi:hypothetical protein
MKTVLRNTLAIVIGFVAGSFVNMALLAIGPHLITSPAGVDVNDMESIRTSMHLLEPKHFIFPFLAHALGTLTGAFVAYLTAGSRRPLCAWIVGGIFLAGGIGATFMIPAPMWFAVLDLVAAYLPMAWLATCIGQRMTDLSRAEST